MDGLSPYYSLGGMRIGSYASFLYILRMLFPLWQTPRGRQRVSFYFGGEDDEEKRLLRCPWYPERSG